MRSILNRTLAVGGLAAGAAAAYLAVSSGLGSPSSAPVSAAKAADATITTRAVLFGHARVVDRRKPTGARCLTVKRGSSAVARSCVDRLAADEIVYAISRHDVGGLAGADVRAVILRLTRKGTVWATLRRGAFYSAVPPGYRVRAVVKVLKDGTRHVFVVTASR
ncbi:MAG: hypothetical protein ACRDM1_08625 [Gaiellaceae bacterium]